MNHSFVIHLAALERNPMKTKFCTYILFFCVAAIAAVTGYVITSQSTIEVSVPPSAFVKGFDGFTAYNPPKTLPPLMLFDLDGNEQRLDSFKGKWRLVNFWATWCPSCIDELPQLLELKETKGGKNFDVVFVSLDFSVTAQSLKEKMKMMKIPPELHTFYVTDADAWGVLSIQGVPTSMLIDPKGNIHFKLVGDSEWMGKESLAFIDDLLNN